MKQTDPCSALHQLLRLKFHVSAYRYYAENALNTTCDAGFSFERLECFAVSVSPRGEQDRWPTGCPTFSMAYVSTQSTSCYETCKMHIVHEVPRQPGSVVGAHGFLLRLPFDIPPKLCPRVFFIEQAVAHIYMLSAFTSYQNLHFGNGARLGISVTLATRWGDPSAFIYCNR